MKKLRHHSLKYSSIITVLACTISMASAAELWALLIANQNYQQSGATLRGPIGNAQSMKAALISKGFRLMDNRIHQDLSKRQLEQLITRFSQRVKGAEAALVYYAGHGVQDSQANYLIPVDAKIEDPVDVRYNGVQLNYMLEKLSLSNTGINLIFLDACRDNPFAGTRSLTRGLARVAPSGNNETLISYSTSQGRTALDNSPYTPALVSFIKQQASLEVEILLKRVGARVKQQTGGKQRPDYTSSVTSEFCFGQCGQQNQNIVVTPPAVVTPPVKPVNNNSREPEMVFIKGGTFMMGSPRNEAGHESDEGQHSVTVGNFYLGKTEVTNAEYTQCVKAKACQPAKVYQGFTSAQQPVVGVSWHDAQAYAKWLSELTKKNYRLPTEAQWEYAARAGTQTAYSWGNTVSRSHANYGAEACCKGKSAGADRWVNAAPVGSFPANRFGLRDMLGNVAEWTCSAYEASYNGSEQRCTSNNDARSRVLRGGSWFDTPVYVRSAGRDWFSASNRYNSVGFRLSRTP